MGLTGAHWYSTPRAGECSEGVALGTGGCTWRRRPLAWVLWLRDLLARGFIGRGDGDMGPPTPQAWRSNLDLLRDEVDGLAARFVGTQPTRVRLWRRTR